MVVREGDRVQPDRDRAIHCYYGYTAKGGPAGVGVAVGRAVRLAIVAVNVVDFFLSLAIWGATTTVRIAG